VAPPRLEVNCRSPYRLPKINDVGKFAVSIDLALSERSWLLSVDLNTLSLNNGGLAIMESDLYQTKTNDSISKYGEQFQHVNINDAMAKSPNEVHIFSCVQWDELTSTAMFYLSRSSYEVLVERNYIITLFKVKTWKSVGKSVPMNAAREM